MNTLSRHRRILLILLALATVLVAVFLVKRQQDRLAAQPQAQPAPLMVRQQHLLWAPVTLSLPLVAEVQAVQEANLASRFSGYVMALPVAEGERFKKGSVLVALDTAEAQATLQRAQAELTRIQLQQASLSAELAAVQAAAHAAQERTRRAQSLYALEGIALEQLQAEQSSLAAAQARLAGTQATQSAYASSLHAAQAAEQAARSNLAYATLRAPFDGMVAARPVQAGDLATPGKLLLRVVGLESQRLLVSLPEGVAAHGLRLKDQVLPLKAWPEANAQGLRRFEARASGLLPGSRTPVQVITYQGQGILLPDACVLGSNGQTAAVFLLQDGGRAQALAVALQASGTEGAVSTDEGLKGRTIACGGADVLSRLAAGVPWQAAAATD
ncbi:MAG: hypothetical protein AUJ20_00345 [Comamonadaceae bacterium CG1_02_60_18]|nr:MAG: hypothetical protein AUJ20_00345 [Comamonadaceae bacterium CG1_02_60_18]